MTLVCGSYQTRPAEIVSGLEILHFGGAWSVYQTNSHAENSEFFRILLDCLVNHVMLRGLFLLRRVSQIHHSDILLFQIDIAKTSIEEDLA